MSSLPQPYTFPDVAQLDALLQAEPAISGESSDDRLLREALELGYADGFAQGQSAAEHASKDIFENARREGFADGQTQGLATTEQAAAALRQALAQFDGWRQELVVQAEKFCVELALAIGARLIELNPVRTEFIKRTIQVAIRALAPELPETVFVNRENVKLAASAFPEMTVRADDSIPPGGARIEARRLLVESGVQQAFEQIKSAVLETRTRRLARRSESNESETAGEHDLAPAQHNGTEKKE